MNERNSLILPTQHNKLIDWIRDHPSEELQLYVSIRQASRCLPAVFASDSAELKLRSCQALLIAFGAIEAKDRPMLNKKVTVGRVGVEPPSAANASIAIREATRAAMAKSEIASPISREVELSLADSFDVLRDLYEERTKKELTLPLPPDYLKMRAEVATAIADDCIDFLARDAEFVLSQPLWPRTDGRSNHLKASVETFLVEASNHQERWKFWREWYQGFLDGKPLNWELQGRVALIEDPIWDAGPEAVAAEIDKIQALFKLEQEIAELKEQLAALKEQLTATFSSTPALIGDNGGPPLDDNSVVIVQKNLHRVRQHLDDLETEVAKPDPSPSILSRIAQKLLDISKRITIYCGTKADLFATEAAKTSGKAIGTLGAGAAITALSAQSKGIQSVAKAIKDFVLTLSGG